MKTYDEVKKWFDSYVTKIQNRCEDPNGNLQLKYDHSIRVAELSIEIGKSIDMDEESLELSKIIGLIHDVGRFEQFEQFRTFSDIKSVNHGEFGVKILKEEGFFDKISSKNVVESAILNHNQRKISKNIENESLIYAKLLRDADKADLLEVLSNYYLAGGGEENEAIVHGLKDTNVISKKLYNDIMNDRMGFVEDLESLSDFKIIQMVLVYDVNFKRPLEIIDSRGFVDSIRSTIIDSKEIDDIYRKIKSFINARLS